MRLMTAFAKQLGAELRFESEKGARLTISWPLK